MGQPSYFCPCLASFAIVEKIRKKLTANIQDRFYNGLLEYGKMCISLPGL